MVLRRGSRRQLLRVERNQYYVGSQLSQSLSITIVDGHEQKSTELRIILSSQIDTSSRKWSDKKAKIQRKRNALGGSYLNRINLFIHYEIQMKRRHCKS